MTENTPTDETPEHQSSADNDPAGPTAPAFNVEVSVPAGSMVSAGTAPIISISSMTAAATLTRGPAFRPNWATNRDAILMEAEQALALCTSATDLLRTVARTPYRHGDNSGPLRDASVEAASVIVETATATLTSLRGQLRSEQPSAATVDLAGHSLTLLGWACKQFAGGMLERAGADAFQYLLDHHPGLFHLLEGLAGHIFTLTPMVHTLLV